MTIETHTTDRKALAHRISELLQVDVAYAGVPSCAYNVGPVTIDRGGAIHIDDPEAQGSLTPFLIEQGWMAPESETVPVAELDAALVAELDAALVAESVADLDADLKAPPAIEHMDISVPAEGLTVDNLKNLVFMLYSEQYLLNRAVGTEVLSISDGLIAWLKEYTPETPDDFSALLADFKALGELDGFDVQNGQVTLTFPFEEQKPENWSAYGFLLGHIVKAAQAAERVFPKRCQPENEKYFMRSWLLRLGLGGPEFKPLRALLLRNLKGHTAFPDDAAAKKHKTRYAEKRKNAKAAKEATSE